jgi:hypothetical protein
MQLSILSNIFSVVLVLIASSHAQDGDKDSSPSAAAPLDPKVSSYLAHLTVDPKYSSIAAAVSTAVSGTRAQSRLLNGELAKITTRTWYSTLPSDIKSFASSVDSERMKLNTGSVAATAPATTTAPDKNATPSAAKNSASSAPPATAASASPTKNEGEPVIRKGMGMGLGVAGLFGVMAL